ncbi:hypothetical protein ACFE04_008367 [Oxalis oulophora]
MGTAKAAIRDHLLIHQKRDSLTSTALWERLPVKASQAVEKNGSERCQPKDSSSKGNFVSQKAKPAFIYVSIHTNRTTRILPYTLIEAFPLQTREVIAHGEDVSRLTSFCPRFFSLDSILSSRPSVGTELLPKATHFPRKEGLSFRGNRKLQEKRKVNRKDIFEDLKRKTIWRLDVIQKMQELQANHNQRKFAAELAFSGEVKLALGEC